jgi:hypothetical protein
MTSVRLGAVVGVLAGVGLAIVTKRRKSRERTELALGRARAVVDLTRVRVHDAVEHSPLAAVR